MKNIVYTFWTKPFLFKNNLYDNLVYLLLSIELTKKFGQKICIYTDNHGYKILDKFNLDVEFNINILNTLDTLDINRWSIPKLYTIYNQKSPFYHIDHDVFLWEKPQFNSNYQIIVQNIEHGDFFSNLYKLSFNRYINNNSIILENFINYNNDFGGFNCGYLEINDINISRQWSEFALNFNDTFINNFDLIDCILIEQFSLYYLYKQYNLNIGNLLEILDNDENVIFPPKIKYTHLMGSKKSIEILEKIEKKIYQLNINLYNKLMDFKNKNS
jgi:hypothetical protein